MQIKSSDGRVADPFIERDRAFVPVDPDIVVSAPSPDDGATTAGGPTMVLILTGILITVRVLRRRRSR